MSTTLSSRARQQSTKSTMCVRIEIQKAKSTDNILGFKLKWNQSFIPLTRCSCLLSSMKSQKMCEWERHRKIQWSYVVDVSMIFEARIIVNCPNPTVYIYMTLNSGMIRSNSSFFFWKLVFDSLSCLHRHFSSFLCHQERLCNFASMIWCAR